MVGSLTAKVRLKFMYVYTSVLYHEQVSKDFNGELPQVKEDVIQSRTESSTLELHNKLNRPS